MGIVRKQGGDGREVTSRGNSHELRTASHEMRQRLRPNRLPMLLPVRTRRERARWAVSASPLHEAAMRRNRRPLAASSAESPGRFDNASTGRDGFRPATAANTDPTARGRPGRWLPRY